MLLYNNYIINSSLPQLPKDEHQKRRTLCGPPFCFHFQNRRYFQRKSFLIVLMRARATCSWTAPALVSS